ncbi:MAG TPA: hypothetical protein VM324_00335 [Egibacteraceae bacterium]|nr:hypothetical protein [Egibacteraceae bacterium]
MPELVVIEVENQANDDFAALRAVDLSPRPTWSTSSKGWRADKRQAGDPAGLAQGTFGLPLPGSATLQFTTAMAGRSPRRRRPMLPVPRLRRAPPLSAVRTQNSV